VSLNLGPNAFDAMQRLKNTEDWKIVRESLTELMSKYMHSAVETGTPDACGYARCLRDVVWTFEVIESGPNAPQRAAIKPNIQTRPR